MERVRSFIRSLLSDTRRDAALTSSLTVRASAAFRRTCSESPETASESVRTAEACSDAPSLRIRESLDSAPAPAETCREDWSIREIVSLRESEILSSAVLTFENPPA